MVDIERDIYPVLLAMQYQETLFSDLEGRKQAGKETTASCPFCNKAGHFSYSQERPLFQCWHCNTAGSWIIYLQKRRGMETREAVNFLAEAAGIQAEGFDMEAVQPFLQEQSQTDYLAQIYPDGKCYPWGVPESGENLASWNVMAKDDLVLGCRGGSIVSAAYVWMKIRNPELGVRLWSRNTEQPFSLICFTDEPQ